MESVLKKWLRKLDCVCDDAVMSEMGDTQMDAQVRYFTYMAEQYNAQEGDKHLQDGYVCSKIKYMETDADMAAARDAFRELFEIGALENPPYDWARKTRIEILDFIKEK